MTTFGVDFQDHLAATKRQDIPYIMEKCIDTLDEIGLKAKVLIFSNRFFLETQYCSIGQMKEFSNLNLFHFFTREG